MPKDSSIHRLSSPPPPPQILASSGTPPTSYYIVNLFSTASSIDFKALPSMFANFFLQQSAQTY